MIRNVCFSFDSSLVSYYSMPYKLKIGNFLPLMQAKKEQNKFDSRVLLLGVFPGFATTDK